MRAFWVFCAKAQRPILPQGHRYSGHRPRPLLRRGGSGGPHPQDLRRPWTGRAGVISSSDLYEREGTNQHAFCARLGREYPYDVRVLANIRPDAYWMDAMLHEFGHAVYDRHVNPRLPYLLRTYAHANTTEAIALMMGALVDDPGWLRSVVGANRERLDQDSDKLAAHRRADNMILTRFVLVMYHFEKALYADPDSAELNSLWWDLVERLLFVDRPPGRDEPDWAAVIHVAVAPVYYHNYMLGELISAQVRNYLESHITQAPFYKNEVAGRYLLESFFGPGARENWRDTVLRAPGEPLNPEHFVKSLEGVMNFGSETVAF